MKRSTLYIIAGIVGVGLLFGTAAAYGQSKTTGSKQTGQKDEKKAVTKTEQAKTPAPATKDGKSSVTPGTQSKEKSSATSVKKTETKPKSSTKEKKQPAATKAKKMDKGTSNANAPQQKEAAKRQNNH